MIQSSVVLQRRLRMLKKRSNTSGLDKKIDHNTNIPKIKSKIPSVAGLVTTTGLNVKAHGM